MKIYSNAEKINDVNLKKFYSQVMQINWFHNLSPMNEQDIYMIRI